MECNEDISTLEKSSLEDDLIKEPQPSTSGIAELAAGMQKLTAWRIMLSDPDYTSADLDSSNLSNVGSSSEEKLWKPLSKLPANRPTLPLRDEDIGRSLGYVEGNVQLSNPKREKFRIKLPSKSKHSKGKKFVPKPKKKSSSSGESSCERTGYKPRPVMRETSEREINLYVKKYKLGGKYPEFTKKLSQAARFWIIIRLLEIHGDKLSIREISNHFDVDRQLFRKSYRSKLKSLSNYNYLSPGEVNANFCRVIKTYGRRKDIRKYLNEGKRSSDS